MRLSPFQNTLRSLDTLLEKERLALILGNLGQIEPLLPQKELLFAQINGLEDPPSEQLSTLHEKIKRNQLLLQSAMDGIRAVTGRINTLRRVRKSLDTYDARGQRNTVSHTAASSVEKRA